MNPKNYNTKNINEVKNFYNSFYKQRNLKQIPISRHLKRLIRKIGIKPGDCILDIACGSGQWLNACKNHGAIPYGIDISDQAIEECKNKMPGHKFVNAPAEELPFETGQFDFVTCLGALEHFLDPDRALKEIVRVSSDDARILLLVPNTDFLALRLNIFKGTQQVNIKEETRTLVEWENMFKGKGLDIKWKWKDLHMFSWDWISQRGFLSIPKRMLQACVISLLPLNWQYQVYHLCKKHFNNSVS